MFDQISDFDSITEGRRALELFTDRYKSIRLFLSFLNDDPPENRIIFFHGETGNGKSLLLKYLHKNFCKRLRTSNWDYVQTKNDKKFITRIEQAQDTEIVPSAFLDFRMDTVGNENPQEPLSALLMLKRQLVGHGISFPLFDFASILYLHKTRQLTSERLQNIFPSEEITFITTILDIARESKSGSVLKAVLALFNKRKRWRELFTLYLLRSKLSEADIEDIENIEFDWEVRNHLTRLFAEDLNVALALQPNFERIVLFFDTHEAFWGDQQKRELSNELYFERDEWFRCLLKSLDLPIGIVAVVAGREPPRWYLAAKKSISNQEIYFKHVGDLSRSDAKLYLERAGIADVGLRECLTTFAQNKPGQVHPLYLGLCADVVLAAADQGITLSTEDFKRIPVAAEKGSVLVDRLLRYVDQYTGYAVRALCACRSFDRDIYHLLGEKLNFETKEPRFELLTKFSFVLQSEQPWGKYSMHELLRRLLYERGDEVTRKADEALVEHYQSRGDMTAIAEYIYHLNRLDWEEGIQQWLFIFTSGWEIGRYELCRAALQVRNELIIKGDSEHGMVSLKEVDYFSREGLYDEAMGKCVEAIGLFSKAMRLSPRYGTADEMGSAYLRLGQLKNTLSQHEGAIAAFNQAIDIYEKLLHLVPDKREAYGDLGRALCGIGNAQEHLSLHGLAIEAYEKAILAFDSLLEHRPYDFHALANKGSALTLLGELYFLLSRYEEAKRSFSQAIPLINKAILRTKVITWFHDRKGHAYLELGKTQRRLSEDRAAEKSFRRAIRAFERMMRFAPEEESALGGKAITLRCLGDLLEDQGLFEKALDLCGQAVTAFNKALEIVPENFILQFNRANALLSLGGIQARLSREDKQGIETCREAVSVFEQLLQRAPDSAYVYNGRASVLMALGQLLVWQNRLEEGTKSLQESIAAFDEALMRAPDYVFAHNNKGRALNLLSVCLYLLGKHDIAAERIDESVAELSLSMDIAPHDKRIHVERGNSRSFGKIFDEGLLSDKAISLRAERPDGDDQVDWRSAWLGKKYGTVNMDPSNYTDPHELANLIQISSHADTSEKTDEVFTRLEQNLEAAAQINKNNHAVFYMWAGLLQLWATTKTGEAADRLFQSASDKYEETLRLCPLMHGALNDWGVALGNWAKMKTSEEADHLLTLACEKHQASLIIKPANHESYLNWGSMLYAKSFLKSGEEADFLLTSACEKYQAALEIEPEDYKTIYNWGIALAAQANRAAKLSAASPLYASACKKFEEVLRIKPNDQNAISSLSESLHRWGNALITQAKLSAGKDTGHLLALAQGKFEAAYKLRPDEKDVIFDLGNVLRAKAEIIGGEESVQLLELACERFAEAHQIAPDDHNVLNNWGTTLQALAETKSGEEVDRLFALACEKHQEALGLKPDKYESFINWGGTLGQWAATKMGEEADRLFISAYEKFETVLQLKPDLFEAYFNWGATLREHAHIKFQAQEDMVPGNEADSILALACKKFEEAHKIRPDNLDNIFVWGLVLSTKGWATSWAELGEAACHPFAAACEKFDEILRINPRHADALNYRARALYGWGRVLRSLANAEKGEKAKTLLALACDKHEAAHQITPSDEEILSEWGQALYDQAQATEGDDNSRLYGLAVEKLRAALDIDPDNEVALLYWSRAVRALNLPQLGEDERKLLEMLIESIRRSGYEV